MLYGGKLSLKPIARYSLTIKVIRNQKTLFKSWCGTFQCRYSTVQMNATVHRSKYNDIALLWCQEHSCGQDTVVSATSDLRS